MSLLGTNVCVRNRQESDSYGLAGADPGFQVRGGAFKKIAPSGGGAKLFWVFRVKIHDFTPKKQITESPSYP